MASTFSKLLTGRNASLFLATLGTSALTTGYLLNRQNVCAEAQEQHRLFPARYVSSSLQELQMPARNTLSPTVNKSPSFCR